MPYLPYTFDRAASVLPCRHQSCSRRVYCASGSARELCMLADDPIAVPKQQEHAGPSMSTHRQQRQLCMPMIPRMCSTQLWRADVVVIQVLALQRCSAAMEGNSTLRSATLAAFRPLTLMPRRGSARSRRQSWLNVLGELEFMRGCTTSCCLGANVFAATLRCAACFEVGTCAGREGPANAAVINHKLQHRVAKRERGANEPDTHSTSTCKLAGLATGCC